MVLSSLDPKAQLINRRLPDSGLDPNSVLDPRAIALRLNAALTDPAALLSEDPSLMFPNMPVLGPEMGPPQTRTGSSSTAAMTVGAPVDPPTQAELKRAKKALEALGYHPGRMNTPRARADVAAFQKAVGLTNQPAGEVSNTTLKRLEQAVKRAKKHKPGYLTPGMKGPRVKKMQERLKKLGDYQSETAPNGIYDKATVDAVQRFRKRHHGLPQGIKSMGREAQRALRSEVNNIAHDPYRTRVKPSRERRQLDAAALREARTNGIGPDSPKSVISYFQKHLKRAGYDPNIYNGTWNEHTAAMARQFERRSDIHNPSDRFGADTWKALSKSTIETNSAFSPTMRIGERSHAVLVEERRLKKAGLNPGKVDGTYTKATEHAADQIRAHFHESHRNGIGLHTHRLIGKRIKELNAFQRPVDHRLTPGSEFLIPDAEGAPSSHGGSFHAAKDWFAPGGTTVRSPIQGKIVEVRPTLTTTGQVFGGTVKVEGKDGKVWVFRHVDPSGVHVGQNVNAGQKIAHVTHWRSGPSHTHVELWKTLSGGYRLENMIDPMKYLKRFL